MRTKNFFPVIILLILIIPAYTKITTVEASAPQQQETDFSCLSGLKVLKVLVASIPPELEKGGLSAVQVQVEAELRLRKYGIKVTNDDSIDNGILYLKVDAYSTNLGFKSFAVSLELQQAMRTARDLTRGTLASTWHTQTIGVIGDEKTQGLYPIVDQLMDQFINEYLKFNPVASSTPQDLLKEKALSALDKDAPPSDLTKSNLNAGVLAERANRDSKCPTCKFLLISNVDPQTGKVTNNWVSKNQREWLKANAESTAKGKQPVKFFLTQYPENADYVVLWTSAQGFRPYVVMVPHVETSSANVNGNYTNTDSNGTNFGYFNGTVQVTKTYYQAQTAEWPYVDVALSIYDKTWQKVYETWHQGNYRWSKPDKDCLTDAFKFLRELNP